MKKYLAIFALLAVAWIPAAQADTAQVLSMLTGPDATGVARGPQLAQSRGVIQRIFRDMQCSSACTIMRDIAAARCRSGDRTGRCWCDERRLSNGRVVTTAYKICP